MSNPNPSPANRFKTGNIANPGGKPAGSRNRLQGAFLAALADDFDKHGKAAIVQCRKEKPADYVKVIASLMPKELEIKRPLEEMSDAELDAALVAVRAVLNAQSGDAVGNDGAREGAESLAE